MSVPKSTECQTKGGWRPETIMSSNGTGSASWIHILDPHPECESPKEVRCQQADLPPGGRGRGRNLRGPGTRLR